MIRTFKPAPIVVYVYNRPIHFKQCLDSLMKNELAKMSEIYVVSDGASRPEHQKDVDEVRNITMEAKGFYKVHPLFRKDNWGVFKSALTADREVLDNHGRMICLEDDILTAPSFLSFINNGLNFYEKNKSIYSISGYCHPIKIPKNYNKQYWFSYVHTPWGFGTWKDRYLQLDLNTNPLLELKQNIRLYFKLIRYCGWLVPILKADYEKKITAGDVRISSQMVLNNMLTVMPTQSLAKNLGFDGSGLHCNFLEEGDGVLLSDEVFNVTFDSDTNVDLRLVKALNARISSKMDYLKIFLGMVGLEEIALKTKAALINKKV